MIRIMCVFLLMSIFYCNSISQQVIKKLNVISDLQQYKQLIKTNPDIKLVEVIKEIPNIQLDIRYATKNNFTKTKLYEKGLAFVSRRALDSLKVIQKELNKMGLGIKIYDAYRPYFVTVAMFKFFPNSNFVAPPSKGSRHNRGCAIDITLVDLKTKKELVMPTDFDAFVKEARPDAKLKNIQAAANRQILLNIMHKHGFKVTTSEWWHFDFNGYKNYPLISIPFEELDKL